MNIINKTSISEFEKSIVTTHAQTLSVLSACTEEQFLHTDTASSIGAHMRHIIECIKMLNDGQNYINYDARARNHKIETNQHFAIAQLDLETEKLLEKVAQTDLIEPVMVTMDGCSTNSTFGRELLATLSHTVHHLAFIKLLAEQQDIVIDKNVGVAPATLEFQRNEEKKFG
ncbi:MAG: DinB family protein [Alphaproteobacteria bacterium]|nr:DinB family protein [Alphaproteobacteria bacterium]